jgi:translocation and assembly module TamB
MSSLPPHPQSPSEPPVAARHSGAWGYVWRVGGALLVLLVLVISGLLFYASTPHFSNQVRQKVVSVLEDATGGRVEVQALRWNLRHLSVEVDGLTIHGLEGPGELPYAHVDRLYARAKILSFIDAQLGLEFLEVDRPSVHLIIYPDGRTNQPTPKAKEASSGSAPRTIFDLQANRVEIHNGLALLNQRAIPFRLAANDLGVLITYAPVGNHYLGEFACSDITAQQGKAAAVHSQLDLSMEVGRDAADLKALHFSTGKTRLEASGSLVHYAQPQWKLSTNGTVELAELTALGAVDGFQRGSVDLAVKGQGTGASQYGFDGTAKVTNAVYVIPYVSIDGVNATTRLHITPDEIALSNLVARPRQGGIVNAELLYRNWNSPDNPPPATNKTAGPSATPRSGRDDKSVANQISGRSDLGASPAIGGKQNLSSRSEHSVADGPAVLIPTMSVRARVHGVLLTTVLQAAADPGYKKLGFDTAGEGAVNIDWTGAADDLTVAANLVMSVPASPLPGQVPVSGVVDAKYFQRGGRVQIYRLEAHSPATTLNTTGLLGVYPTNEPSNLSVHLVNHNLAEFDQVLKVLDLGFGPKKGIAGIPIRLHGDATFDGSGTGSLEDPAFAGHLTATQFSTVFEVPARLRAYPEEPQPSVGPAALPAAHHASPATDQAHPSAPAAAIIKTSAWDHLDATGSYSSSLISVEKATLTRGDTVIHASGQLQAHQISRRRHAFDDDSAINATAQVHDAPLADLLAIAGEDLPVTGNLNLQAHAGGTLGDLNGGATIAVAGGTIAGQHYRSLAATLTSSGQEINLTRLTLLQDGGTVIGNGTYNLKSREFLGNLDGSNFELAHFPQPKDPRLSVAGALKFDAHASGTIDAPSILGGVHLRNLVLGGQPAGALEVVVHTQGNTAYFTAQNSLATTGLHIKGQTSLGGNFETQANLLLTNLNIAPFLRAFHVQSVTGNSSIGGTINVAGPLREPNQLSGDAEINQFSVTLQGIPLQATGPLRASMHDGILHITQAHITGPETDVAVTGTAALTGDQELAVTGNGAVNMKLAQTFDPDITSSGHLDFNVNAGGTLTQPSFSGRVRLTDVALALNDLPNGITKLNGNLIFDQNRLEVQELVGTTGGGQLKFGGFLTYQQGIYGDFTATGKDVRVRYLGISATADTTLHLQGSQTNMLLSGSVQITRFIIGPNVDFANFAPNPAGTVPPDPNAPSSHVRLDVHIYSAPQLDFQNSYAQLAGSVDLRIRGTVAQPAILGRINVTDGTATFAGTTYRLQHGEIFFTNPVRIDPIIDIDATTRVEEYDVTIGLHGNINQLTPTFRSEPPLPPADVISLLALGRTQEEQALYSQQEQSVGADSTSNALLGGALNAAVGSRVQRLFGVGSVKIDPTYVGTVGSSSARITVQQNISRNVQVTYATNVNATAQQLIQAQVDITQSLSVLAVRDEAGVFSMVLRFHKRYR